MDSGTIKICAALDVGTSNSGYAYFYTDKPGNVLYSDFGGKQKTPTALLVGNGKKMVAFGDEAESQFVSGFDTKKPSNCRLYRNFKCAALNDESLAKKTSFRDVSGHHSISLFDLFSMTMHYLKNHLMRTVSRHVTTYSEDEARFVIIVPTIADDRTKWFYRQAAIKAGIRADRLSLVLESEAASVWLHKMNDFTPKVATADTRYILADLGGGVVDISAHASVGNVHVDSLSAPRGGTWGGNNVVDCWVSFLHLILHREVVETYIDENVVDWLNLLKQFECSIQHLKRGQSLTMNIPTKLLNLAHQFKGSAQLIDMPFYKEKFQLNGNMLTIEAETVDSMYQYTVNSLTAEVDAVLHTENAIKHVIVIGGMSDSDVLQNLLSQRIDQACFPDNSSTFALSGALLLAQETLVDTRILPLTYALHNTVAFDEERHKGGKTSTINGMTMCTENFHCLVKAGTKVTSGQEFHENDMPLSADDSEQTVTLVSCGMVDNVPSLVTHLCVHTETSFTFPLPFGCQVEDKVFDRCLILGETETYFKITFQKGNKKTFTRYLEYK